MKPKTCLIFAIAFLMAPFLFAKAEARELGCLGRGGLECYCCSCKTTAECSETFAPCSCPGADRFLPFYQDLLGTPATPDLKLLTQKMAVRPQPTFRNFSDLRLFKPPPPRS